MKEYKVYLKDVNWYRTTVTAACEEDAKDKAEEEMEHKTLEDWEEGHARFADSSHEFLTETEMAEAAAQRDQVADLKSQLAARDAELAALREENAKLKLAAETRPTALEVDGGRVAPKEGEFAPKEQLFAAIRAQDKDRVRQLLEMGADVNAYEPVPCDQARDLRCVSLSRATDRARN